MDFLTVEKDFRNVWHVLYDIRHKCKAIGYELGLSKRDLINLQGNDEENMSDVIEKWLRRHRLNPTWATLAAALREETVNANYIADEIEAKYLGGVHR